MEITYVFTVTAGVLFLLAFVPYIFSILKGQSKPAKASWVIWAILDTITLVAMYAKNALNGQIIGAVIGAWVIVVLAFRYGKPGWAKLDKYCLGGAVFGIALWIIFNDPIWGIVVSNIVVFLGAFPTYKPAWNDPWREDKLAWTLFWISCVFALLAIPAWTLEDATQPVVFFAVESIMMYIIYVRARQLVRSF